MGVWGPPQEECVWISKRYACKISHPLRKKRRHLSNARIPLVPDSGEALEGRADQMALFSEADLHRHIVADFLAADHQHPAAGQLLQGDAVQVLSLIHI